MATAHKTKINVDVSASGNIVLRRNGKDEVVVKPCDADLLNLFTTLLIDKNDYESFCTFWGTPDRHLADWLIDVILKDKERKISWMFERVIIEVDNGR